MTNQAAVAADPTGAERTLLPHLLSISKTVRQLVSFKLAGCEVMAGQDQFLLCFADGEAVSVVDIAERLSVRASTVSKMADILQRKGWIGRLADERDARKVLVHLTESGGHTREAVRAAEAELEAELLEMIDRDDTLSMLARVDGVLAKRLSRLR